MGYTEILTSVPAKGVLQITLNRPKQLNALNQKLMTEVISAIKEADSDISNFGAVVLYGSTKSFAAGADIKEMKDLNSEFVLKNNFLGNWDELSHFGIPIIAAVEGLALGGGCELAMLSDIIYASKTAKFGQPEVKLGIIPGGGGTQRLIRAIGKSKAMEIILTGETFTGEQAEQWGLVSRAYEPGTVLKSALELASKVADGPRLTVRSCKRTVNAANELGLQSGIEFERSVFHSLFGNSEQKEGMSAFVEKRKPEWKL